MLWPAVVVLGLAVLTAGADAGPRGWPPALPPPVLQAYTAPDTKPAAIVRDSYTVTPAPPKPAVIAVASTSAPAAAQAIASVRLAALGQGGEQFACLVNLWNRESGWRVTASNPSGAYGIPQALPGSKMARSGADWRTSAATQISWGLGYIMGLYGSPCAAWSHAQASGWY